MNIINILFPIKLQLTILQLEEYSPIRFLMWISDNFFTRNVPTKRVLVYTTKVKHIIFIYMFLCGISFLVNPFITLVLLLFPFIGLTMAVLIIKPYEIYNRKKTIKETRKKIISLKKLKVIGITGSFGKTSTKEILYQLVKNKYKTLRTPESFNTVFGIAKVVDLELDNSYEIFICEMAAYKKGEIKNLCYMVPPKYGLLTGITTQHFERFGSLENTIKAKFELVDSVKDLNNFVFNLEDENILKQIPTYNFQFTNNIKVSNIKFTKNGSEFDLEINKKIYKVTTSLFGFANIKNILLASDMSLKLGLPVNELIDGIRNLKPFDNRNVLIKSGKAAIVNNTYSSNVQSFKEMIQTAKKVTGKKLLVTPGIVELGKLETSVHRELGKLSDGVFDYIILVGKNNRTSSFASHLTSKNKFEIINDKREEYFNKIEESKKEYDWIFLENDVTQNY